ncbi:MAG: DMT family transporter [Silicimonas sp.]|nr:DMT family transporter [Silicimonas sp.]
MFATAQRQDRAGLGIALTLIAWFCFSLTDTSVKWLLLAGLASVQLAFMRYATSFALSLAAGLARGRLFDPIPRRDMILVLIRAALLVFATLFNFIALNYLPLSVTSTILNAYPIIGTALAIPLLGERVGPWRIGAVIAGFIGVVIVIRPFGAEFHWATLLMLSNAVFMAFFGILTRQLSGSVSPQSMQITMGGLGTIVLAVPGVLSWTSPVGAIEWAILLGVGTAAWIGHELFSRASLYAEANVLMPFSYIFILYLAITGFLVFGTVPDTATFLGAGIIISSGLLIWWRERKRGTPHD